MRSLTDRIARLVGSPQAQHLAHRAQQLARDPRTRRTIEDLRTRLARQRLTIPAAVGRGRRRWPQSHPSDA